MAVIKIQNDFTHGELDPRAISRFDLEIYGKAAAKLKNVLVLPTGGAIRRFGTKFVADLGAVTENEYKLDEFYFDSSLQYVLVFTNLNIAVYKEDVFQVNIVTTYTSAEISIVNTTTSANLMILAHPDHPAAQLVRGGDDVTWTLSDIAIKNEPGIDFNKNYDAIEFKMTGYKINASVTLTSDAPIFTTENVGAYFISLGGDGVDGGISPYGLLRITVFNSSISVIGDVVSLFSRQITATGGMKGKYCILTELAWSATRGYPISCTFYESRLYFGGSKSAPGTIFSSIVNDYTDFNIGVGNDSDSIQETSASIGNIRYIIGDRSLNVFTDINIFTSPQLTQTPLTPGNISIRKEAGSESGVSRVEPQLIDNSVVYVSIFGKEVKSFVYSQERASYTSQVLSLISSQVVKNPVDSTVLLGSSDDPSHYYVIVNGTDGSLGILQTIQQQNINSWTNASTDGEFKRIHKSNEHLYFIVKRNVDGNDVTYLERSDFTSFMDSTITQVFGGPETVITGLSALEAKTVHVIGDGFLLLDRTISGGQITIERASTTVSVGLPYKIPNEGTDEVLIETLPINVDTQIGPTAYTKKRIFRAFVDIYQSLGVKVNEIVVPTLEFGPDVLDQVNLPQDELAEIVLLNGWDPRQTVKISQDKPLPMTIRGIGINVEV